MNKLHLLDSAFLPFGGVFSFLLIDKEDAVKGIQDAVDHEFLVNRVRSLNAARILSKLCDREITADRAHVIRRTGIAEIDIGDAALLCPHLSATRAEKRRDEITEHYVFVMCMDIHSPQGLADKIVTAKPDDMLFPDWMTKVGEACGEEHRIRIERSERIATEQEKEGAS